MSRLAFGLLLLALAAGPVEARVARLPLMQERFLVHVAYQLGLALAVLVVLLMVGILGMRVSLVLAARRERRFMAAWRPRLLKYMVGEDLKVPRLSPGDRLLLFRLWSHMHESVRGQARERLNTFARQCGLDKVAWRYANSRRAGRQLVGLLALGSLQEGKAWNLFKKQLESPSSVHSLAALRGLLAIDERLALPVVVPSIARRSDWSPVRVASFLKEVDADTVARHMGKIVLESQPAEAIRLLKYLTAINCFQATPFVRRLARRTKNPGILSACLGILSEAKDLTLIRRQLRHEVWFVRVQAATALGKIGRPGDEALLQDLLTDGNWWVRYRAAQALTALPFLESDAVQRLSESHEDAYARDILSQVLAEPPLV